MGGLLFSTILLIAAVHIDEYEAGLSSVTACDGKMLDGGKTTEGVIACFGSPDS